MTSGGNSPGVPLTLYPRLSSHLPPGENPSPDGFDSTGNSVRAPKTPTTSLPAPGNFAVSGGDNEGELEAQWDPVSKAKNYEVQISDDPPTANSWTYAKTTTKSKTTITACPAARRNGCVPAPSAPRKSPARGATRR